MELTGRRGVDVVLNALAAEAIPMGLSCLAEFGRFIEIGKRDIYQNSRIPLWPLRRNASFHVVAMDAVFAGDEALTRELLAEIAGAGGSAARCVPLPFRSFPASRVDAAFRLMAQGKHIGKVVVAFSGAVRAAARRAARARVSRSKPDGAYLITGAFGGFGKVLAEWLVECGARHLVLASRSGAATPEAEAFVARPARARAWRSQVVNADVGVARRRGRADRGDRRAAQQPLRGVFHLAMVIDDAPLAALTRERMRTVMAPKAHGAWLLHEATREHAARLLRHVLVRLEHLWQSGAGQLRAANAFLDALAHHRRALGLPALTINWGVLGGEGYVARNERVAEFLARQGTTELSPGEVMSLAGILPRRRRRRRSMAIRVDWAKWRQFFRGMQENPLLERIFAAVESQEPAAPPATSGRRSPPPRPRSWKASSARPCARSSAPCCA